MLLKIILLQYTLLSIRGVIYEAGIMYARLEKTRHGMYILKLNNFCVAYLRTLE